MTDDATNQLHRRLLEAERDRDTPRKLIKLEDENARLRERIIELEKLVDRHSACDRTA